MLVIPLPALVGVLLDQLLGKLRCRIVVHRFATPPALPSLRSGLPANENQWRKLACALKESS